MPESRPLTILCVSSYEKGQEFLRTCKAIGCRVLLLTVEKLRDADWPRESIDEMFFMPEELPMQDLINAVSFVARSQPIDRIVALDEFDMENVSALREHLRIPGMGLTTVRYFRDKLAMRARAKEAGIAVPEFVHVLNYDALREFMARVPAPLAAQAAFASLRHRHEKDSRARRALALARSAWRPAIHYLLEQFIPGSVYHVDSVVSEREVVFAEAHAYGAPPLETSHQGGVFTTRTLPRDSAEVKTLLEINRKVLDELGFLRGVTHAEFLRANSDGKFYFLEVAARVGGAYISDVIEAATGINLWREWARLEVGAGKQPYQLPPTSHDYAGVIVSLARQERPDTSAYNDPEIVYRITKYHHAGFVLKSPKPERIEELLDSYSKRFQADFLATQPVPEKPSS